MPDLGFQIEGAEVAGFAATPTIVFKLRVSNADVKESIQAVMLRCQIQLEVTRRRYTAEEQRKLTDLFGEPERWSLTLKNLLWMHITVNVPAFQGTTVVDVPVPCTFDFNVAATKYFHGLAEGEAPLCFMFSGTAFYTQDDSMQVSPISWDKEARYRLPVKVWREMMDTYYPGSAWLCLRRDTFERLCEYKVKHGIPTWEEALESLLAAESVVRQ
jgi:hypothetical protein